MAHKGVNCLVEGLYFILKDYWG